MFFFTHNIGEFSQKTRFLSPEEVGVFVLLRDQYLTTEQPLQCNWIALALHPHCKESVNRVLGLFFRETESGWVCDEFENLIEEYRSQSDKKRQNAQKRWSKAKNDAGAVQTDATAMQVHSSCNPTAMLTKNQEPITNNQELIKEKNTKKKLVLEKPDGVSPKVWDDFLFLRKQKKAPLTETALKGIAREAAKAGISLEDALSTCCQRGWQGFNSEWILGNGVGKANGYAPKVTTGPKTLEPDWSQIDYGEGGFL